MNISANFEIQGYIDAYAMNRFYLLCIKNYTRSLA